MTTDTNTILRFYRIEEVAAMLSTSKMTIYRLVETRKIPFYRIKGCIRFAHADIVAYLEQNRIGSVA